jgi:hypothetical protein
MLWAAVQGVGGWAEAGASRSKDRVAMMGVRDMIAISLLVFANI